MPEETIPTETETFIQPDIEGLRIVGTIDPAVIAALEVADEWAVWVGPDEPIPEGLMPLEGMITDFTDEQPEERIEINVTKFDYDPTKEDPFFAKTLAIPDTDEIAHRDRETLLTRLVCDSNPAIFYPVGDDGKPDINRGWQPKPGEIVEYTNEVWHSPPLSVEGEGTRKLVTLRRGFIDTEG